MANFEFLRNVPLFAEMSDSDLESMCLIVQELHLRAGEVLFEEGSDGDTAYIVERGEVDIVKTSDNREILLAKRSQGEVFGEMALLLDQPRSAGVRARTDTDLIGISRIDLRKLMQISSTAASSMFDILVSRLQNTYALLRQSEKMAQLGTFTAGIAHELNNPAAAVQRSTDHLSKTLFESAHTFMRLVRQGLTLPQQETLERYVRSAQEQAKTISPLSALARSDREAELEEWLENHNVDDAWECATMLVNLGFTDEQLDELAAEYSAAQLPTIIDWLNNNYTLFNLLGELQQGAGRISSIVKALKSYTYLDQAPITRTDVHQGLDDTLLILRHKLKNEVAVVRDYDPDLPQIEAYGSELNQVWTNLIDNAADALRAGATPDPTITLRTRREGSWIIVTVEDNGPGISPENLPHIFETFFTTKPIGQGTGLGLDISYNIIARRHKGDIRVRSEPGRTQFDVWLPIELKED